MKTIHLIGVGEHPAILARDAQPGMTMVFNYGSTAKISTVHRKGKSIYIAVHTEDGGLYTYRKNGTTLIAIKED